MTEVVRISGAPGCGKTTRLFDYVAEERDDGRSVGDIYYVTFSRSAVNETKTKLAREFPDADDAGKRGRTFHSLALRLVMDDLLERGADVNQIIQQGGNGKNDSTPFYKAFCDRWGLDYDPHADDPLRPGANVSKIPDGNRLFDVASQLKLRMLPPEKCLQQPVELPRDPDTTAKLLKAWEMYKQAGREDEGLPLYEHYDYVTECVERGYAPDVDVLFIDEFQDLSPLEYKLYKVWRDRGKLERIYIAGDAQQSIYGSFRAARPEFFTETPVDREDVLRASYRCPSEIVSVARGVLDAHQETDHGGYTARSAGGTVANLSYTSPEKLGRAVAQSVKNHETSDGNRVFLLARSNYQVRQLAKALRSAGVPHQRLGRNSTLWTETMGRYLYTLRSLREDRPAPARGVKSVLQAAPGRRDRMMMGGDPLNWAHVDLEKDGFKAEDVWKAFPDADGVLDIVPLLGLHERKETELQAALGRTDEIDPAHVKIGTMHSAKGLEAPCVYLFAESTSKVLKEYRTGDAAEEHRLHYVAATRASETLNIVRDYFGTDPFPPFELGTPYDAAEVVA